MELEKRYISWFDVQSGGGSYSTRVLSVHPDNKAVLIDSTTGSEIWSTTLPSPVLAAYILTQDLRLEKISLVYANSHASASSHSSSIYPDESNSSSSSVSQTENAPVLRIEKYGDQYFVFPPTVNSGSNSINSRLAEKEKKERENKDISGFPLAIRPEDPPKSSEIVRVDERSEEEEEEVPIIVSRQPLDELTRTSEKSFEDKIRDNSLVIIAVMGAIIVSLLAGIVSWNLSRSFYGQQAVPPSQENKSSNNNNNNNSQEGPSDGVVRVGRMEVYTNKVLGRGSIGTVVFEGRVDERRVAVKRILKEFYNLAQREISLLLVSDEHPNLVRYYSKEEDNDFIYLSITYCVETLGDWVANTIKANPAGSIVTPEKIAMMKGIAAGVAHIHLLNIVHRDLKPENILIDPQGNPRISDMGLAKKFEGSKFSYSILNAGSAGWMAPEILRLKNQKEYEENIRPQIFPLIDKKDASDEKDEETTLRTPRTDDNNTINNDDEKEITEGEEEKEEEREKREKEASTMTWKKDEHTVVNSNGDGDGDNDADSEHTITTTATTTLVAGVKKSDGTSKQLSNTSKEQRSVVGEREEKIEDKPIGQHDGETISTTANTSDDEKQQQQQQQQQQEHPMVTKAVDVFSLGCIFFYIATGNHPFGPKLERDMNILQGNINLREIYSHPELVDLVRKMTNQTPWKRISTKYIPYHPFFWDTQKQLQFMLAASDRLEVESQQADIVVRYEDMMREKRLTLHWDRKLDKELLSNLKCYRKYNFNAARDLLRVMRNKANHYYDLPQEVQDSLGSLPEGFMGYFKSRFPRLFILTYNFLFYECRTEPAFSAFFPAKS